RCRSRRTSSSWGCRISRAMWNATPSCCGRAHGWIFRCAMPPAGARCSPSRRGFRASRRSRRPCASGRASNNGARLAEAPAQSGPREPNRARNARPMKTPALGPPLVFPLLLGRSGRAQRLTVALRGLDAGETLLDGLLHLLEGADLDLAHALAGDAELAGEILERDRVVAQAACLEDAALALVEHAERLAQGREAVA